MKPRILNYLLAPFLALGFVSCKLLSLKYVCDYPEAGPPSFYGFPFVQETGTPWVNSLSYHLYWPGYLANIIIWACLIWLIIYLAGKVRGVRPQSFFTLLFWGLSIILLLGTAGNLFILEPTMESGHDNFKVHYFNEKPVCSCNWYSSVFSQ